MAQFKDLKPGIQKGIKAIGWFLLLIPVIGSAIISTNDHFKIKSLEGNVEKLSVQPSSVPSIEPSASASAVPSVVITTAPVLVPAKPVIKSVVPTISK